MSRKLLYSISIVVLLLATSSVRAEVVFSTARGNGADTFLSNDGQTGSGGSNGAPEATHGTEGSLAIRNYEGVRQKIACFRFDLIGITGNLNGAVLSITLNSSNRTRNWLVYGLVDESLDNWDEATICYNNAPGILSAALGSFAFDETKLQLLGTLNVVNAPNTYTSNSTDLNLDSFLASDTNKLVTFIVINENSDSNASYWIAAKEGDPARAATLSFPNATLEAAADPYPEQGEVDVLYKALVLSWSPSESAVSHDVYFGDDMNLVSNASRTDPMNVLLMEGQVSNTFALDILNFDQTYYWRIDEVSAPGAIYKGPLWSFTTEPLGYPIDSENITATASGSEADKGPENTINGSGLDQSGLLHGIIGADTMWQSVMPSWIEYEFDRLYKLNEMWVWNSNEGLEPLVGLGIKEVTIEYSANGTDYTTLGTQEFTQATGQTGYAHNTTVDFGGAEAKYVRLTVNSNWGGLLNHCGLSEVRFFYIPVSARKPSPGSGAADVEVDVILNWRAGREALTHNVYLSSDQQAVIDGTVQPVSVTDTGYSALLDLAGTYYWRVDEVNVAETPAIWQGDVWSFSTSDSIVVDDFESYNDIDPPSPKSHRIFESWGDGYGIATNGALVGHDPANPSYAETVTVHEGRQAMPLFYDNTTGAASSEATYTFAAPQDWTQHGIQTLMLYFYGTEGNTGQLYVKINDVKIPYTGDPGDLATASWHPWSIDLAGPGVDLANVTMLVIGVEGGGAAGTLYFDDIRLQ